MRMLSSKRPWDTPTRLWEWAGQRNRKRKKNSRRPPGKLQPERHLTGQELCEAIRQYAVEEFGYLAKSVLNSWGVYKTRDFGNIVFNLIEITG